MEYLMVYPSDDQAKELILEIGRRMYDKQYVAANDGNITCKTGKDTIWATPTGVSKGFMKEEELVKMSLDGKVLQQGRLAPSSEIKMHLRIYNENPKIQAVCHAHPPVATSFAIAGISLDKAIYPEALVNLGVVPVARYSTPGSQGVPDSVAPYCRDYNALLLANHGALTWGGSLMEAWYRLEALEHYATIFMNTEFVIGKANALGSEQIGELVKIQEKLGIQSGGLRTFALQDTAKKAENIFSIDVLSTDILTINTVDLDEERKALKIIDQTKLPGKVEILYLTKQEDIYQAIYLLKVRGAPAIGVAAAIGLYLAALEINEESYDGFYSRLKKAKDYLAVSRPTAVNLFWALDRMEKVALDHKGQAPAKLKELLHDEAIKIRDEDIQVCKSIGEHGLELIKNGDGILTHCNAGQLATVRYGTALAAVYLGRERGMNFKVFCDETRPLLQGARLSAFEMVSAGVDTTLICDNMASMVMKNGWVKACFVGCDRVASNGDTANKIGTSGVAILAKHYGIPFYVCAPTSTIDMSIKEGKDIVIEERKAEEVTEMWYRERMAPLGVKVFNPAFDVTDHDLITAIVTEFGIVRPPYSESLKAIFEKKARDS